jgi:hypothetical protein
MGRLKPYLFAHPNPTNAIIKGCFKSEETGGFYLSKINIPNHYPEQKI